MLKILPARAAPSAAGAALVAALVACGGASPATPQVVLVTATAAPTAPSPTAAIAASPTTAPAASPTAAAQPTSGASGSTNEGLRSSPVPTTVVQPSATSAPAGSTSSGSEGLRGPAAPTAARKPAAAQASATPAPAKPASPPTSKGTLAEQAARLQAQPSPTAARKGQPNASVPPAQYVTEIANDSQVMRASLDRLEKLINVVDQADELSDEDAAAALAAFQKEANAIRAVYAREVARDYPPQLKEIDDYYVETVRYASRFVDTFLVLMQSGDERQVPQLADHYQKFTFFGQQLADKLNRLAA